MNLKKYSQNLLDHTKQSATDALETTSNRVAQKTAEATGDWSENSSGTVTNETKNIGLDREIPVYINIYIYI